jgi:ABC-type dipeptide/oligopeptide/nickel transport system permease component
MGMYVLRRLLALIPVLLGVTLLTFAIIQVTPGDPVFMILGENATPERIADLRDQLGLNDPLWVQYTRYIWDVLHGDFGKSIRGRTPVLQEILLRFPHTLRLALAGMFLAVTMGVSTGILAATVKDNFIPGATMLGSLIGLSIPNFWLAIVSILFFGVKLNWISVIGGEGMKDLILPASCLAIHPAAVLARLTRSCVLEVFREDYVLTARAKGLMERVVVWRHVVRNALIPVVTVISLQFGSLLGGTIIIESVFARPGLGRWMIGAITARDYPQIQGMVLFMATVFVSVNLAVDLLYGFLDPRIRLTE